jgi:hypothetical protein
MAESLFSRVTRYPPSPSMDPRENRLTEITAAVLERVDELAEKLLLERALCLSIRRLPAGVVLGTFLSRIGA